jgi:hypothetical protein
MPIHSSAAPAGMITHEMKARFAAVIIEAHVEATGARRVFFRVFFRRAASRCCRERR